MLSGSSAAPFEASTVPRLASQCATWTSETRTCQEPPCSTRRASATRAPSAPR